jgi:hypothetical protein
MATSGGDIKFTFSGDSSGLNSELSKVDNNLKEVTKTTTGTANGLGQKLKSAAERAAGGVDKFSNALGGMKKPVREWDQQRVPDKFDDTGDAARRASVDLEAVEDAAGNSSSQLSALAGAVGHVSPQLGQMAGMAADSAGALEGLGRMAMRNPVVSGVVAASVAALGIAFKETTDEVEELEEALELLDRRQDVGIARIERFVDLQDQINQQYRIEIEGVDAATVSYEAQRAQIENLSNARIRSINEMEQDQAQVILQTRAVEQQTAELLNQLDAVYLSQQGFENFSLTRRDYFALVDAGETRTRELVEANIRTQEQLDERMATLAQRREDRENEELERAAAYAAQLEIQNAVMGETANVLSTITDAERGYVLALADEETQIRAAAEAREQALAEQMAGAVAQLAALEDQELAQARIAELEQATRDATVASQAEMLAELKAIGLERIENKTEELAEIATLEKEAQREQADRQLEADNERKLADIERINQTVDTAVSLTGAALEVTTMMEDHMAEASGKQARRFFRIRQAAAIADILMTTQQAVMRSLADLGPIAGAAASIAIGATSAASIGAVAAEKPPAFDVGGMIRGGIMSSAPDQMTASVLPGEAILNRSATERLGEGGVNALNRGGSTGGVVVVPAYRHFDRFIQDEYRKGGSFRRIVSKERQFPVGQRRY